MNDDSYNAIGDRQTADRALYQLGKRERALAAVDEQGRARNDVEKRPLLGYVWALRS